MIIALMYHQIHCPKNHVLFSNFKHHLETLVQHYQIVVPGEAPLSKPVICLTFDDASFDFYYYVFPLLKQLNIKAVLGVPTHFIETDTITPVQERLNIQLSESSMQQRMVKKNSFCTWRELKEMAESGHVLLASHSHHHVDLTHQDTYLVKEIVFSKDLIREHTGFIPDIFIYPYGKNNVYCQKLVQEHYQYSMRIGTAINLRWNNLLYRINAEEFWQTKGSFGFFDYGKWLFNYYKNRVRKR